MVRLQQGIDQWNTPVVGSFPQSDTIDAMDFTAAGAKSQNVPSGANFVRIRATTPVYVRIGGAAAVPGADVTDGSASELLLTEGLFALRGASAVGVAVGGAAIVTLAFYG